MFVITGNLFSACYIFIVSLALCTSYTVIAIIRLKIMSATLQQIIRL